MGSRRTSGGSTHLKFEKLPLEKGRKMHKYDVINIQFREHIGIIHFRGGWRKYVWTANLDVDMSVSCMDEIKAFIGKIMKEWRESLKKKG
jgi:hypothetical protein